MKLLRILLKYTFYLLLRFLFQLLRFTNIADLSNPKDLGKSNISKFDFFKNSRLFLFSSLVTFSTKISNSSLFNLLFFKDIQQDFKIDSKFVKSRENIHLLRMLCFFLRINLNKDSEALVSKIFNLNTEHIILNKNGEQDLKLISRMSSTIEVPGSKLLENQSVSYTTNQVFPNSSLHLSANLNINSNQSIENVFLHNNNNSFDFLTKDSGSSINFDALQNLYKYFKTFSNPRKALAKLNDNVYKQNLSKVSKRNRIPKNFKGGTLKKKNSDTIVIEKSQIEALKRELNILKQIEFLLKNKKLLEAQKLNWKDLNLAEDVKKVMFSKSNKTGPYGSDSVIYTSDLYSKNKMVVARRITLLQNESPLKDLTDLKSKLGFANFNFTSSEEFENSSDVPLGGWFTGQFYFINPFVVLGFVFYSILELIILIYIMSFFFGNPYETLIFFLKYPLVYFYDNLSFFPSANYFFSALMFWLVIIFTFQLHLIELIDEERFDPPHLSWASHLLKDFMYTFLVGWCGIFCIFELLTFCDLLISRVFFIGVPGYPNILSILFLAFHDIFYLLGCTGYFSFYLENFIHLDIKFPAFYFSDYVPLVQRYPLVQPYFFGNPFLDRPNFFLWICDSLLNFFSGENKKSFFLKNDEQLVFQREFIQDIRKYNYIRKNLTEIRFLGQLHARGWNGFNYRLDLQTFVDPIIPSEQVIRFDWRLKNTHSNGMYSRLFSSIHYGTDSNRNNLVKKIRMFRGRRLSSRYGYFSYLKNVNPLIRTPSGKAQRDTQWFLGHPQKQLYSILQNLPQGARKTLLKPRKTSSYFFSPTRYRFANLLRENKRISTKADRNFRYSRSLKNFWSSLPGNDMPRHYFRYKPFISITSFANFSIDNYNNERSYVKRDNLVSSKSLPIENYSLRNLYLNKPQILFPTNFIDEREFSLKTENSSNSLKNPKKIYNINHKNFVGTKPNSVRPSRNFSSFSPNETNFISNQKLKSSRDNDLSLFSSNYSTRNKRLPMQKKDAIFYKHSKKKKLNVSSIPNFPFRVLKKHKFASKIFQNFQPKYFLRPTASFTTFSKIENISKPVFLNFSHVPFKMSLNANSGFNYTFSIFFLGFGRFFSGSSPIKFISFDYYYSQNHNFFYSLFDNYLKQNQFRVMLTSKARFNHPLKGGFRHNLDFLYPMLSELRLKEKLIPLDFLYNSEFSRNYIHLRLDPYESIRTSKYVKSSCYFLDARIQNWLNFNNVIWNEYFHFFFNRSFKTEGNGSKFFLASYNPIQGPSSYKLFIDSPTLETPRVGQYFYNYISWLQYKFKWLLHPTSTYKRFDSFRFVHQHANKKFYFTSLLKFYQMNLFRWQQAAQIFQWNQLQSRNFLLHLFFHKYQLLFEVQNLKNLFDLRLLSTKVTPLPDSHLFFSFKSSKNLNLLDSFNVNFFLNNENLSRQDDQIPKWGLNSHLNYRNEHFYIPAFTSQDFRFFQYVTDLRRWKALQTAYIRDWKFEKYVQYLGPMLYKDDVASLMGFFAPFEYRNQIIVSKMRNDSLRFSVFFPKKVIDEKFVNPGKRLSFPPQQFHSRGYSKSGSLISTSKPMYYAYVINRPFLSSGSNYSFFSKKGKKIFSGLYPNLDRFNLSYNFNLVSDANFLSSNFSFNNNNTAFFYDLNSKKKRFLHDKDFWLSKNYELQQIRDRISASFGRSSENLKIQKFRAILDQFGKPLDTTVPTSLPKMQFFGQENKFNLGDSKFIKLNSELFQNNLNSNARSRPPKILPYIYPDIFMRFGGPKASSRRWHLGQSWMKFVVATQNVSVFPEGKRRFQKHYRNNQKLRSVLDSVVQPGSFSIGFDGKPKQYKFSKLPEIKRRYGFFNFGLSGIGRLPRLSRSFFHMLFFRNKLDDFKNLKIQFLKLYLMSVPLFHNTDFSSNASFKIFWSFLTGAKYSKYAFFNFRYNLLFTNFNVFKTNINFSNFIHHPHLGTLFSSYRCSDFLPVQTIILHDQYSTFKALQRFRLFSDITYFQQNNFSKFSKFTSLQSSISFNLQNLSVFFLLTDAFDYIKKFFFKMVISFSFNFFNYFFVNYQLLQSKNDAHLIFFDFTDKNLLNFSNSNINYSVQNFLKFKKSVDYSMFYVQGFNYFISFDYDNFRSRMYHSSFRSNLHWYYYPVHYYSLLNYFVSENVLAFFTGLLKHTFHFNLKFASSPYFYFGNLQTDYAFKYANTNNFSHPLNYSRSCNLKFDSDFFKSFTFIYANLTKLSSNVFLVLITNRVTNFEFLKNLYLYENSDSKKLKYFLTFNTFFFSQSFFSSISRITNHLNLFSEANSSFAGDFEFLLNNLFDNSISIDGSGRHNRPKSVLQTLNKIFTYREYEKYRHEHHRQRFRGITPHWVQNTVKNRANYQYFFRSAEYRKRKKTRFLLNKMFRYVRLSRSRFSPQRLNRISFKDPLTNTDSLINLLFKNKNFYEKQDSSSNSNSSVNFVDTSHNNVFFNYRKTNFFYNKFFRPKFPEKYVELLDERSKILKEFFERNPRHPSLTKKYSKNKFFKYRHFLLKHSPFKFSFKKFKRSTQFFKINDGKVFTFWFSPKMNIPVGDSDQLVFKQFADLDNKRDFFFPGFDNDKMPTNLKFVSPTGFYRDGGNFINTQNSFLFNNLFSSLTSYYTPVNNKKFFNTSEEIQDSKGFTFDTKIDLKPTKSSLRKTLNEPFRRTSPLYLRTLRSRRALKSVLTANTIGGSSSTSRYNSVMKPKLPFDVESKRRRRFTLKHPKKYPSNVKRFVRPFSKVIMSIPYLYSKWFTQNPRLSASVNNDLLKIFTNNSYDEFNYICVQSLLLLKRKMMFNVVNIRLISYKHKILYFSNFGNTEFSNNSKRTIFNFFFELFNAFLKITNYWFSYFESGLFFVNLYQIRSKILISFFQNEFFFVRLLYNPLVRKYTHESEISSDMLFFEDFYYKQTARRLLSQIAFSSHSLGGWNNPIGIVGHYIPGLNFYSKKAFNFNFNYQYPDFYSGRSFSPEFLLDNNLVRHNTNLYDRNYFFHEFFINSNYRKSWHFLSPRINSPVSPFIEYEKPHRLIFQRKIKNKNFRLPLMSLRRVRDVYPNYLKSFFSTLVVDKTITTGHDITLPFKLKLLNFDLKSDPYYKRELFNYFKSNSDSFANFNDFSTALKYKQFKIMADFHNKMNLSSLVNKRRFGLRKRVWSPFRYNFYYKFNWRTFLHKFSETDLIGFRNYKLNPYFDLYNGTIARSLKLRAFQHLIVSQIPRSEIDSRRRVPTNFSSKEFSLLFYQYFNHVNNNFQDKGYSSLNRKILKYVSRKSSYYQPTHFFRRSKENFANFYKFIDSVENSKINFSNFLFKKPSVNNVFLPKYDKFGNLSNKSEIQLKHSISPFKKVETYINSPFKNFKKKNNILIKTFNFLCFKNKYILNYLFGKTFFDLSNYNLRLRFLIQKKYQRKISSKGLFKKTIDLFLLLNPRFFLWKAPKQFSSIYFDSHAGLSKKILFGYFFPVLYPQYLVSTNIRPIWFTRLQDDFNISGYGVNKPYFFKEKAYVYKQYHSFPKYYRQTVLQNFLEMSKKFLAPYRTISRIYGVNTLFNLKKSRERFLNPQSWLSFDLFSRVRPSFRPFLYKFSKQFMFSKFIPAKGISSYNTFIRSYTLYDSFFERHPYIAFSIGLGSNNNLISSETMYKEIRKRSNILDFSRRHWKFFNPLNFHNEKGVNSEKKIDFGGLKILRNNFYLSGKFRTKRQIFFNNNLFTGKRKSSGTNSLFFTEKMRGHFTASKVKKVDVNEKFLKKVPKLTSVSGLRKKFFSVLPLHYRFNGILRNTNYYSYMTRPVRRIRFLNTFLIKPYNSLLKFIRYDNFVILDSKILSNFILNYGSLNPTNNSRMRSYYQPNLKLFFDFNAYKQRYNLGLLFRGLSFENDFQFFLFRKTKFFSSNDSYHISSISSFLNFSLFQYFNLIISKDVSQKGFVINSKLDYLLYFFEKFIYKVNPMYLLLIFVDFYLGFFYSVFFMFSQLYFFDFSFFLNFFNFSDNSFYYLKKRPIFQIFFHIAYLNEYLKFSWLFSIKFLIFNFEYYPYYFLIFSFLLILRIVSFNINKKNFSSPFIVPYNSRFSDFRLNVHSGWFDTAWKEVKLEAFDRLYALHNSNSFNLSYNSSIGLDDIKRIKRRYKLQNQKTNFFEPEDVDPKDQIDLSKYESLARNDEKFQRPLSRIILKRFLSRMWFPSFLLPSFDSSNSGKLESLDFDVKSRFLGNSKVVLPSKNKAFDSNFLHDPDSSNIRDRSRLSFFFIKNQIFLFFAGKISFFKLVDNLNFGLGKVTLNKSIDYPDVLNNYKVEDFSEEFSRLFIDPNSEFNSFSNKHLVKKRMFPDDENIHFYRKPGSILHSELLARKRGTETDQLYYVVEFPGKFNNTYINAFSKAYAIRNLNFNAPYYGFFTFPKNAKLPNTFEEFVLFCSDENNRSLNLSQNPKDKFVSPDIEKMKELWSIFQYVVRYEYNMFNEFDFQDSHLFDVLSKVQKGDRYTLFDNLKFWFNKASVDAIDLNFWNRNFYLNMPFVSNQELDIYGSKQNEDQDMTETFNGSDISDVLGTPTQSYSLLYIFYVYLIFFVFFFFLSFFFCCLFLFFVSLYNYVLFFF